MIKRNKLIIASISVLITVILSAGSGCSLNNLMRTTYDSGTTLTLRDIDIDEKEAESIKTLGNEMEKSYDISQEISSIADELDNPFEPFYFEEETDGVKNILVLENIFYKDETEYCEIKFNDHTYILTLLDTFQDVYMIKSINESSVIILKGDEVLTLFIGEMVHD
jgi:hypothetical protein